MKGFHSQPSRWVPIEQSTNNTGRPLQSQEARKIRVCALPEFGLSFRSCPTRTCLWPMQRSVRRVTTQQNRSSSLSRTTYTFAPRFTRTDRCTCDCASHPGSDASFRAECNVESIDCILMRQRLLYSSRLEPHGPMELKALLVGSQ